MQAGQGTSVTPMETAMGWLLPLIAGLTPLLVIQVFMQPHIGQGYFMQLAVFALAAVYGVGLITGSIKPPRRFNLFGVLLLTNIAIFCISTAQSTTSLYSIKLALLPVAAVLMFLMIIGCRNREPILRRMSWVLIGGAVICAVLGILQFFDVEFKFLNYSEEVQKNKVVATIGHPNYLSSFIGPMAFILLGLMVRRPGVMRMLPGAALAMVILFCIALARTRAVWLGIATALVVVLLAGLVYSLRHRGSLKYCSKTVISLTAIFAFLTSMVLVVLPGMNIDLELKERLVSKKEIDSRLFYWKSAIEMSREKPVFGNGYARFDPMFWNYTLEHQKSPVGVYYANMLPAISGTTPEHVHNEYIQVLCEQGVAGVVGLIALLSFFVYFGFVAVMREPDHGLAFRNLLFYAAFILIAVDAIFSFPWRLPASLMVAVLTCGWMYHMIYPNELPAAAVAGGDAGVENAPGPELRTEAPDPEPAGPMLTEGETSPA